MNRLDNLFKKLQEHGLKLIPLKCHFFRSGIQYMGYTISTDGISASQDMIIVVDPFLDSRATIDALYRRLLKQLSQCII